MFSKEVTFFEELEDIFEIYMYAVVEFCLGPNVDLQ